MKTTVIEDNLRVLAGWAAVLFEMLKRLPCDNLIGMDKRTKVSNTVHLSRMSLEEVKVFFAMCTWLLLSRSQEVSLEDPNERKVTSAEKVPLVELRGRASVPLEDVISLPSTTK